MGALQSEKCTQTELAEFREQVISFLKNYGIDTSKLKIRCYPSYNGDVKVYTGEVVSILNSKSSFRRIRTNRLKNLDGSISITYEGTRGHHTRRYSNPIVFNRDEFPEMIEALQKDKKDLDRMFWEDCIFEKLDRIKKELNK